MAEVKNSFLKSRMNQDLDDRLIPNGEYRYANNISVGKSESDDIGALQNILGNERLPLTVNTALIPGTDTINPNYIPGLECIGIFMDNQNNRIFQFLTDYEDPTPSQITVPTTGTMMIAMYNFGDPITYTVLVEGLFLNFAKNKEFRITGVNLVEGLLFWTDNRNQPRKINVSNALGNINYYTTEEQISVAKYAPIDPITLYKKVVTEADGPSVTNTVVVVDAAGIVPGMTLITPSITGTSFCTVVDVTGTTVTFYESLPSTITDGTELIFLISTMSDKSSIPSWPGDPAFLEDKYVRFSYRFKYDDNEYSLMAPFTQIAYVPKQKGYFIAGNETDAYRSTILNWFENNINNIELIIPFPDKIETLTSTYKIVEIDILYKESDSAAIKVFETVPISNINTPTNKDNNYYIQQYQSQKPYKTLSEDQTVRVYDKVPVRAKAQESAGNRIIYGNYYDKYTSVSSINYNISVQPKSTKGTNFIEYPNHTLKKNRNYQVGFIIADKFGRQSPVILSTGDLPGVNIGSGEFSKGSTLYSSYENSVLFTNVRDWFGDALILYLNSPISQPRDISAGQPGLYAIPTSNSGFAITALSTVGPQQYTFTMDLSALASQFVPEEGNILRGKYVDYVKVLTSTKTYQIPGDPLSPITSVTIETSGEIGDIYIYVNQGGTTPDIKFSYEYNAIGWYSYKIVVKQQEQDYYNVYLPGMLNGYPEQQTYGSQVVYTTSESTTTPTLENGINTTQFPVSETGNTSHIVLINDNINKVPRDLSEVGPDQKQYRSSVQLYGRVENTGATITIIGDDPEYSAKVITINYTIVPAPDPGEKNTDWILIKPGDGIQCVEANTPVNNTTPGLGGTKPNPYRWLGDTVVVSNVVVGTAGTITISSPNWVIDTLSPATTYKTFIITRAENTQYFPTRKADTVISIASADEFNFLDSSENNLKGTAGLNFYQLQTKPLIGRVSTVNTIGVGATDMIPFLSVYETRAQESLLELFWETTTTGLISDLNADVLSGFSGPSSFGNFEYKHFENQDPNGLDTAPDNYGQPDSKYITDKFVVLNSDGVILSNAVIPSFSVVDLDGNIRTSDFSIESITSGANNEYRLFINAPPIGAPFVFNHNAPAKESYVFTFNVIDTDDPSTATQLVVNERLGNNAPIITPPIINYNITQSATIITTLEATNGSFYIAPIFPATIPSYVKTGLKWSIVGGSLFFEVSQEGVVSLTNSEIPLGIYDLVIRVQDAVNTTNGEILDPENTDFGTKYDEVTLTINVGDEPVPYWLRPNYASSGWITPGSTCTPEPLTTLDGTAFGMVYIGKRQNLSGSYLPNIPGSNRAYQIAENIEIVNANGITTEEIIPTGLIEGEYRVKVELRVPGPYLCDPGLMLARIESNFEIYFYKRMYNGVWALSALDNNQTTQYTLNGLVVTSGISGGGSTVLGKTQTITTSFTINSVSNEWEYAIGIKMNNDLDNTSFEGPKVFIYGEDANYSYPVPPNTLNSFSIPVQNYYEYYTNVMKLDNYTSGIPYETQDATRGVIYESPNNLIASGQIFSGNPIVTLTLNSINNQIAPGLFTILTIPGDTVAGQVVDVNISNPAEITIQLIYPVPPTSLAGQNLLVRSYQTETNNGKLYANTIEGTEVKQFYTDSAFTQKWIPPFADKFYVFRTSKNYNPGGVTFPPPINTLRYTEKPYYCAKFNGNGKVIDQITPLAYDVQTAWVGQNNLNSAPLAIANYSYNVYYVRAL
jgi:hypothetical protein